MPKVLIVDDHEFVRMSAESILRTVGFREVCHASNGTEAQQQINRFEDDFDLIVCDLNMPDEDGFTLLRHLANKSCQSRIVLLSGEDNQILDAAYLTALNKELCIVGRLHKPLTVDKLRSVLGNNDFKINSHPPKEPLATPLIREAIEQKLIEVWFQPQINVSNIKIHGAEALARLRRGNDIIFPDEFIDIVEQEGLISQMTDEVVCQSLEAMKPFIEEQPDFTISINISATGVDLNFPDRMAEFAEKYNVPTHNINFELTESALANDQSILLEVLARLKMKRFRLSIDDFGTGFSSLAQLKEMPFQELKIDKSFVMDATEHTKSRGILEHSLTLTHSLGLLSVAEGVETEDHMHMLRTMGGDIAQGYYFSRPLPLAGFTDWYEEHLSCLKETKNAALPC